MSLWSWLGNIFHDVKIKVAPLVVGILQIVKDGETSGLLPGIAKVLAPITDNLSVTVNNAVQADVNKQLALWLGVENLSADPTPAQETAFATALVEAFSSKKASETIKGQVEEELGVQLYNIITTTVGAVNTHNPQGTAATISDAVEEAYQDLVTDLANAQASQDSDPSA